METNEGLKRVLMSKAEARIDRLLKGMAEGTGERGSGREPSVWAKLSGSSVGGEGQRAGMGSPTSRKVWTSPTPGGKAPPTKVDSAGSTRGSSSVLPMHEGRERSAGGRGSNVPLWRSALRLAVGMEHAAQQPRRAKSGELSVGPLDPGRSLRSDLPLAVVGDLGPSGAQPDPASGRSVRATGKRASPRDVQAGSQQTNE